MTRDLSPAVVAARLARLRASWRPHTAVEARALFTSPARIDSDLTAKIARRLRELRALMELTTHLHGVRSTSGS